MKGAAGSRRLAQRLAEMIDSYWHERGYRVACVFADDPDAGVLVRSDLNSRGWPRRRLVAAK
jgi:hypothetical protein